MELILASLLFLTLGTALFAFGAATLAPAPPFGARLRALVGTQIKVQQKTAVAERLEQALEPISKAIPKSPSEVSRTRAMLMQAGYREARHLTVYFGMRALLALSMLLYLIVTRIGFRTPLLLLILPPLGYILPRFFLKRMIRKRQHAIRLSLPDALDLAVICVEVGLSLDQAMQRVGDDLRHSHPQLSDELRLVNLEMRAGKPRAEALRNLASRTGVDDIRALVAVLVQTDRFGTSIAQALRVHSDSLRSERRQRAEEQAAKTTIKMVPALIFFVFPSMFIVTLGPAAILLIRNLLPVIQK